MDSMANLLLSGFLTGFKAYLATTISMNLLPYFKYVWETLILQFATIIPELLRHLGCSVRERPKDLCDESDIS